MLPLLRPKHEKDLREKLRGKRKRFRLSRNGGALSVTGKLLAVFRRPMETDGLMPPTAGRVELLAVILTQAGRYFLYYIVTYPETEDIAGRHEYAHVCPDQETVAAFLDAMQYPNKGEFTELVLAQIVETLTPPVKKKKGKADRRPPDVPPVDVPPASDVSGGGEVTP